MYADSTAVLGPLATYAEPHCYDLCHMHSERLTAPRGWEIVRITPDPDALKPTSDDLEALANAVREAARPRYEPGAPLPTEVPAGLGRGGAPGAPADADVGGRAGGSSNGSPSPTSTSTTDRPFRRFRHVARGVVLAAR